MVELEVRLRLSMQRLARGYFSAFQHSRSSTQGPAIRSLLFVERVPGESFRYTPGLDGLRYQEAKLPWDKSSGQ